MDFNEYIRSCESHLQSQQIQPNGESKPYYKKVDIDTLEHAKVKINDLLEEGYENEYISKNEFEAMKPGEKGPAKFYQLFKVHKPHEPGRASPRKTNIIWFWFNN